MVHKYWTKEDCKMLDNAVSYKQLLKIALRVLARMPRSCAQVCGPISTGGAGSVEKNLKRFDEVIEKLQKDGIDVFNQVPFEIPMQKIKTLNKVEGYDNDLLNDFYLPIFESRLVNKFYFLPDWESSVGARWEHEQVLRLGFDVIYME